MQESPKVPLKVRLQVRLQALVGATRRKVARAIERTERFLRRHLTEANLRMVSQEVMDHREIALLVFAGVMGTVQSIWPSAEATTFPFVVGSLLVIPVSIYFRVDAGIKANITAIVMPHQRELSVRRQQLYRKGSFGLAEDKAWRKEVERFLDFVIAPRVSLKSESRREWARNLVNHVAVTAPVVEGFFIGMTPVEYEHLVARTLRAHGWSADTTKGSGDQGVDVLATRARFRLVVQCKLYSNAVGNAAVQEAIGAREWEGATHAAVVSNASYTKSAKELAHKAGVLLLHHDDLPGVEGRCAALSAHVARRPGAAV